MPERPSEQSELVVTVSSEQREFGHFLDALSVILANQARLESEQTSIPTNARMRAAVSTRKVHIRMGKDVSLEELTAAFREAYAASDPTKSGHGRDKLNLKVESLNWPEAKFEIDRLLNG